MHVAPDVLWVVLALPLIAAMGLAPALLTHSRSGLARHERAMQLALAAVCGLLVNHALGMLVPQLRWVLVAGFAVAAASLAWALARHREALLELLGLGRVRWLLASAVLLLFAGPILFESLRGWDARSVWFFAAKRMFFGGGLGAGPADWTLPAYGFSHSDYPKLLPLLGAQFADAWGVWNEFIPKASLLVLLFPVVIGLLGLPRRVGLSLLFLGGLLLMSTGDQLWNGYADTYMCLYAVLAMLYLARWLASGGPVELALGSAYLGVAVNLKNEGALVALCVAAGLIAWMVFARSRHVLAGWRGWPSGVWLALALPWIGFLAWMFTKQEWQLANDLQLGAGSLQRVVQRLAEGKLAVVAKGLIVQTYTGRSAALLLVAGLLAWALRVRIPANAWFPAAVATMYLAGMFLVYLATPHDVGWHMETSAARTMLLSAFGYLGSTFLVLETLETAGPAPGTRIDTTGLQT